MAGTDGADENEDNEGYGDMYRLTLEDIGVLEERVSQGRLPEQQGCVVIGACVGVAVVSGGCARRCWRCGCVVHGMCWP